MGSRVPWEDPEVGSRNDRAVSLSGWNRWVGGVGSKLLEAIRGDQDIVSTYCEQNGGYILKDFLMD